MGARVKGAKVQEAGCGAGVGGAVHVVSCAASRVRCTLQPAKVQEEGCGARVEGAGCRQQGGGLLVSFLFGQNLFAFTVPVFRSN